MFCSVFSERHGIPFCLTGCIMNENMSASEMDRVSSAYVLYAKNAKLTMKQLNFRGIRNIVSLISVPFDIWAIIVCLFQTKFYKAFGIILLGIAVGLAVFGIFYAVTYLGLRSGGMIERTEGYSPKFYEETERLYSEKKLIPVIAADCFLRNGYADRALEILSGIDSGVFVKNPSNAHLYYAYLITAYLLKGDMESAQKSYNNGLYYLRTYMNSPAYGDNVSLALGIYEYYCGHYDTAAGLLDNALRILTAARKPKTRIPEENFIFTVSYWKAMCFAAMGNKAAAWDILNSCKNLYRSDYYGKCAAKLFEDMAEDEKRKNEVTNETIS